MAKTGLIYIIAAASGTGKTSLVKKLINTVDNITTSISHTTRPKRKTEHNGKNYYFISKQEFAQLIADDVMLEYAEVYGQYYGTSRKWVATQLANGLDIILEIDWQGMQQIKKLFPNSISIFILPPSMEELQRRLEHRNQDTKANIEARLAGARKEITRCNEFDYIIVNNQFEDALADLRAVIDATRSNKPPQLPNHKKLLEELTKN